MASDLIVAAIHIPPWVVAGCPTSILVDIKNVGSDAAPLPFQVCLEISVSVEGRPECASGRSLRRSRATFNLAP